MVDSITKFVKIDLQMLATEALEGTVHPSACATGQLKQRDKPGGAIPLGYAGYSRGCGADFILCEGLNRITVNDSILNMLLGNQLHFDIVRAIRCGCRASGSDKERMLCGGSLKRSVQRPVINSRIYLHDAQQEVLHVSGTNGIANFLQHGPGCFVGYTDDLAQS